MKNKVRVLSLIMTVAMILSSLVIVIPVNAEEPVQLKELSTESDGRPWTEFASETGFAGGTGTKENPYQIATAEQLALLALFMSYPESEANAPRFQSKYYVLTADIDLAGHEWVAIANSSKSSNPDMRFRGFFDGQGHTIKNLTVTPLYRADWSLDPTLEENKSQLGVTTAQQQIGLFGYLGGGAIVENFTLTGSINIENHTNASSKVGLVVGEVSGSSKVLNVDAYGKIKVVATKSELPVGGIVGRSNNTIIEDCTMNGSIEVYSGASGVIPCVGGITSQATGELRVKRTVNNASVTAYGNGGNSIAGGIVGKCGQISSNSDVVAYGTYLDNCVNNGAVTVCKVEGGASPNNQRIGGIVGNIGRGNKGDYYMVNVELNGCVNTGSLGLGDGVNFGTASGICSIAGLMEKQSIYKRNDKNQMLDANGEVTTDKNQVAYVSTSCKITMKDCFAFAGPDTLLLPHYNASSVSLNGGTATGYGMIDGCDVFFAAAVEVSGKNATIRFHKDAVDGMVAAGYTLSVTYGDFELTAANVEELAQKLTVENDSYTVTTKAQADAEVAVTLSQTLFKGTDIENTHVFTAKEATWSDFYTEDYFSLYGVDADDAEAPKPGTEANPYVIYTAGQFAKLSADIAAYQKGLGGTFFILANDIDLSAHEWQPIGLTQPSAQNGNYAPALTLLGYGHSIKNVRLTQDYYNYSQSFIGYSTWNISDVTFDGITIKTPEIYPTNGTVDGVAGVIGAMYGGELTNVHVKNLDLDYEVNGEKTSELCIGGLVGYANGGVIDECSIDGSINVIDTNSVTIRIGGVIGCGQYVTIYEMISDVNVNVRVDNKIKTELVGVGGFIGNIKQYDERDGFNQLGVSIENSFNVGSISLDYSNREGGYVCAAGFVGVSYSTSGGLTIKQSMNLGSVSLKLGEGYIVENPYTGSIIGYSGTATMTMEKCISMTKDPIIGKRRAFTSEAGDDCFNVDLGIDVEDRAGLRLNVNDLSESGMIFRVSYDQAAVADLLDEGYALSFGMIIAPTEELVAANGNVATLKSGNYIDCSSVTADGKFAGAVINMDAKYLRTDLSAIVSVTVTKLGENGDDVVLGTVYSAFEEDGIDNSVYALADYVVNEQRSEAKTDVFSNLTKEGDYSPYTYETLERLKEIYFPAV